MSLTFESGAVLLMYTYRRIREMAWDLTWRSVSLLAILKATRDGSSTTQLRRRLRWLGPRKGVEHDGSDWETMGAVVEVWGAKI